MFVFPTVQLLFIGRCFRFHHVFWALLGSLSPPSPQCHVWLGSRTFSDFHVCCFWGHLECCWTEHCCGMTLIWCLICCWTPDWARWRRAGGARCCGSQTGSGSSVQAPMLTSVPRRHLLHFSDKHRIEGSDFLRSEQWVFFNCSLEKQKLHIELQVRNTWQYSSIQDEWHEKGSSKMQHFSFCVSYNSSSCSSWTELMSWRKYLLTIV